MSQAEKRSLNGAVGTHFMSGTSTLLEVLADGHFHSGEVLGRMLGVSRTAVWKHLRALQRHLDVEVQAVRGRGYRLRAPLELLQREAILAAMTPAARQSSQ